MCRRVYILLSQYHGSNSQLRGLAEKGFPGCKVKQLNVEMRTRRKWLFPIWQGVCHLIEIFGADSGIARLLRRIALVGELPEVVDGDVVLIKTAPFEFPGRILCCGVEASLVILGQPRRLSYQQLSCIISTPSTPAEGADVFLASLPSKVVAERDQLKRLREKEVWCILIGGDARNISYQVQDWRFLFDLIRTLKEAGDVDLQISTSPRTPKLVVDELKALLSDCNGMLAVFGEDSHQDIEILLRRTDVVVVTEDSASMVCDAVNTKRPVICLRPSGAGYNSMTTPQAIFYESHCNIFRETIQDFDLQHASNWRVDTFRPIADSWATQWRQFVIENFEPSKYG